MGYVALHFIILQRCVAVHSSWFMVHGSWQNAIHLHAVRYEP